MTALPKDQRATFGG
jgi:hypothetical protein